MKLMFVASALLLCACDTLPEGGWDKPGATDAQFMRDRGACVVQMESAPYGANKALILAGCMQSKGWSWETRR